MTKIVTILTPDYADWEAALLNASARSYFKIDTAFATPDGQPVTSAGGLKVTPDLAIADIDPWAIDALVVNGGAIWSTPEAPSLEPLLKALRNADKIVAGICDGTLALARAGILDHVRHTSNHPDNLTPTGYAGAALYVDQPEAVRDGKIVTAPGTAPVSFMAEVYAALGLRDENLDYYVGMYGAEHAAKLRPAA